MQLTGMACSISSHTANNKCPMNKYRGVAVWPRETVINSIYGSFESAYMYSSRLFYLRKVKISANKII